MSPDSTQAAADATATGLTAVVVATIGVHPQFVMWAMVGSVIGASFAPPASRVRAALVFVASSLCCALFGSWVGGEFFGGSMLARDVCACALGILFHPLLTIIVQRLPAVVDGAVGRITGGKT